MVQSPRKRFEYEKARLLRKRGLSYNQIRKQLGVSKSSVSLWCCDIELSRAQRQKLQQQWLAGPRLGGLANRVKREKEIIVVRNAAAHQIKNLKFETFKVAGAALYWAEGAKTQGASISNSDPKTIEFMVRWFNKVLGISPMQLKAHLHIHYGNDDKKIKRYWSLLTGIPLRNFGKSFIKPKGMGHRTNILPRGVITVRIKGRGTGNIRHIILAWAHRVYELSVQYKNKISRAHSSAGRAVAS